MSNQKTQLPEMMCFGVAHVWNVSSYIGIASVLAGIILIAISLFLGPNWSVLVSVLWTLVPTMLVYGIIRRKRFFFRPYIFTNQVLATLGLVLSVGLMFLSFTRCYETFVDYCKYVKFGGPIFALSVCMLYFSYVISMALRLLDNDKQEVSTV